jgi:hypothetical protein
MSTSYGSNGGGIFASGGSGVTGGGPDPANNNYSTFFAADPVRHCSGLFVRGMKPDWSSCCY